MPTYRNKRTGQTVELPEGIQPSASTLDLYVGVQESNRHLGDLPARAPQPRRPDDIATAMAGGGSATPLEQQMLKLPTEVSTGDRLMEALSAPENPGMVTRGLQKLTEPFSAVKSATEMVKQSMRGQRADLAARDAAYHNLSPIEKAILGTSGAFETVLPGLNEGAVDTIAGQLTPMNIVATGAGIGASKGINMARGARAARAAKVAEVPKITSRLTNPVTNAEVNSLGLGKPSERFAAAIGRETPAVPPRAMSSPVKGSDVRGISRATPEQTTQFVDDITSSLNARLGKVKNANSAGMEAIDDAVTATGKESASIRQRNRINDARMTAAEQKADGEWYATQRKAADTKEVKAVKVKTKETSLATKERQRIARLEEVERARLVNKSRGAYERTLNDPEATIDPRQAARDAANIDREATDVAHQVADEVLQQQSTITEPYRKPVPTAGAPKPKAEAKPAPTAPEPQLTADGKVKLRPAGGAAPTPAPAAQAVVADAAKEIVDAVPEARTAVAQAIAEINAAEAAKPAAVTPRTPAELRAFAHEILTRPSMASEGPHITPRQPAQAASGATKPAKAKAPSTPKPATAQKPARLPGGGVEVATRADATSGSAKASLSPGEEAAISVLDAMDKRRGKPLPGNGTFKEPAVATSPEMPAIDATTLEQLAALEKLTASSPRGRVNQPPTAEGGPINFNEMTPPDTRIEDVLRSNPRFQALSKAERAARYKELGGANAGMKKVMGPTPNKGEAGFATPEMLGALTRTAGGGAAGAYLDDENRMRGATIGAGLGALSSLPMTEGSRIKQAFEASDALRYEGMLSGGAQVTNAVGNLGGLTSAPFVKLLQGDLPNFTQLVDAYHPRNSIPQFKAGFKEGFDKANLESTKFGNRPIGPAGRMLRGVDRGTKNIMESGGMSPREAEIYTYSGNPVTGLGKGLEMLQANPVGRLIAPFVRTAINAGEVGAALSPLRWMSPKLQELIPSSGPISESALGLSGIAPFAAGLSGYTPQNATVSTLAGAYTVPAQIGAAIRDYEMHGRGGPADIARSVVNQTPFFGDVTRATENPKKALEHIATQPIPAGLYAVDRWLGGGNVKETEGISQAIQDRIPIWRNSLPDRRNFFGEPLRRNMLGQYPQPLHSKDNKLGFGYNDPVAGRLAEAGILRREPSSTYTVGKSEREAGFDKPTGMEKSRLQQMRGEASHKILAAIINSPGFSGMSREAQDALLKLAQSRTSTAATQAFKRERITKKLAGSGGGQ